MLVDSGMDLAFPCLKFPTTNKKVDQCSVRQVTLEFYLEDGRHHETVVEDGLRASDLCNLLTLKFCLTRSFTWTIFEQFSDLGIERSLEDHEEVFQMYTDDCNLCSSERKFIMRQNLNKYQFLRNPENFYPLELVDLGTQMDCVTGSTVLTKMVTVQNMLHSGKNMPAVQSFLWFKEPHKNSWRKYFFRLEDNVLRFSPVFDRKKPKQMYPLLDLQNSDIFLPMEGKCNKAPTKFGFCLKPKRNLGRSATVLRWFCCASEKVQECWMVALRLAKFGKKLVENYREVKSRWNFLDSSSLYQSKTQEKHRDIKFDYLCDKIQVAMDFTGKFGCVVQNPAEVEAITAVEAQKWKKKLISNQTSQASTHSDFEFGVHSVQPWFYTGMSREESTQLLTKYGTVDGVFLVRESHRNPSCFVLSYVYNRKVHHTQILPMEEKNQLCYTLDGGKTKFYDLLQLIEFYQLNLGYLPTKLTHFFIHQKKKLEAT